MVEYDVAIEEEFADVDRRNEATDARKCVGLSLRHRVDDLDIDKVDGKVRERREESEFGCVEIGLACYETAHVVAHDGSECFRRKYDVAHDDYGN